MVVKRDSEAVPARERELFRQLADLQVLEFTAGKVAIEGPLAWLLR